MKLPKTIGLEIKSLANLMKRRFDEMATYIGLQGLTGVQGWIIGYLYEYGNTKDLFQRDLEKEFKIRRSTATGILQLMERNGLITREPVEYDGRLKQLKLTAKAVALHERVMEKFMEVEERLRRGLSEKEVAAFFSITEKIKDNLE